MAFTVREFHDLIRILEKHPEWREELRRQVFTDELLSLPGLVRDLAEAQRQTDQHLQTLTARVDALAEAQRQTQVEVRALTEAMPKMAIDVSRLKHWGLEQQYRIHAPAYFGRLLRGLHVFSPEELAHALDQAVDKGRLSQEARHDILLADLVLSGRPWDQPEQAVYLVVEVSWRIGMEDVERAVRWAERLHPVLRPAFPAVAGTWATPDAKEMAQAMQVLQVTDGTVSAPEAWWSAS